MERFGNVVPCIPVPRLTYLQAQSVYTSLQALAWIILRKPSAGEELLVNKKAISLLFQENLQTAPQNGTKTTHTLFSQGLASLGSLFLFQVHWVVSNHRDSSVLIKQHITHAPLAYRSAMCHPPLLQVLRLILTLAVPLAIVFLSQFLLTCCLQCAAPPFTHSIHLLHQLSPIPFLHLEYYPLLSKLIHCDTNSELTFSYYLPVLYHSNSQHHRNTLKCFCFPPASSIAQFGLN